MARGVVVLGMHRSGTSALSRVMNLLGADIGPEDDLLTEHDNPAGHWENKALVRCNDRILASFGRSWDFPPWFHSGWEHSPQASALLPAMEETFEKVFAAEPWVWKDPRTCLTFPLWRRVLGPDLVVVLVLRHPADVVASLRRRDGMPRFYATGLWHHYLLSALASAAALPVVCRSFEDLLREPVAFTSKLAYDLGVLGVDLRGDVDQAAASVGENTLRADRPPRQGTTTARPVERLALIPPVSDRFSPPLWPEPRWVRPALTAYRVPWAVRARAGHPLRPRFA